MSTGREVYRKASHGKVSNAASSKAGSTYSYHSRASKAASSNSSVAGSGADRPKPSIWSILATRRMARALTSRFRNRGRSNMPLEPTYRMEPAKKFNSCQVERVIKDVLEANLHDFSYQAKRGAILSRLLTEEIKDRVKALEFDRYKIVCVVTLGQKIGQDMRVSSRCMWDENVDSFSSYSWENSTAFCSAIVYGIYHE